MQKRVAAWIALSSFAFAAHAAADPAPAPTASASDSATAQLLAAADTDQDGTITSVELGMLVHTRIAARVIERHRQLDRNRDGKVARAEVPKMASARFSRFDMDRDGNVTVAELSHVMADQATARLQQVFARIDADGNARCTLAELGAHHEQLKLAQASRESQERSSEKRVEQARAGSSTTF